MAGSDMKILIYHAQDRARVTGIAGNMLLDLPIVTGAAFIETMDGPIIGIFHQYVYYSKGKLIHSVPQLESYENQVMCTSRKKCGMQRVVSRGGWIIPLHIRGGLPYRYMDMRPLRTTNLTTTTMWPLLQMPHGIL